jgi:hypothetical protein
MRQKSQKYAPNCSDFIAGISIHTSLGLTGKYVCHNQYYRTNLAIIKVNKLNFNMWPV